MPFSRRPLKRAILPPLICLFLLFSAGCRVRVEQHAVLIKDARIVGAIDAGAIVWGADEDQAGSYFIVTKAYPVEIKRLAFQILALQLEIKELKAKGKNP
jgi:hypothetical protein